jgi:signal transduction histidine kinase
MQDLFFGKYPRNILLWLFVFGLLGLVASRNYILFHGLAEIFSIVIAGGIFMFAWTSRPMLPNDYLLFVGIGYLFVGSIDLLHTLAYKGMGILSGYQADEATQLWIAARYMESVTLFAAPIFLKRRLRPGLTLVGFGLAFALIIGSIFFWGIFPACYIAGQGLTSFKIGSEYLICLLLLSAIVFLLYHRRQFESGVLKLLIASILLSVVAELTFTTYSSVYGWGNFVGHLFKILSFYLIYIAIIDTGLKHPYSLLFRDLKQSREEERRAKEELKRERHELARSNQELEQFAYIVSHDLREPLRTISSFLTLVRKRYHGQLDAKGDEFINYAVDGADRLDRMIRNLLEYSRIQRQKQILQPTPLFEVWLEVIENLHFMIEETNAHITHDPLPMVRGDRSQLVRLLQNLIANAITYCKDRKPEIHIGVAPKAEKWQIAVQDNGIGIDPGHQERIFKIFQRLHTQKEYPGTGIGLAICKKIVERHGGGIWVDSETGKGTTFYFTLPKVGSEYSIHRP